MATTMSKYGNAINRPISEIVGLSTDTKPTEKVEDFYIQNGSLFIEMDTNKEYLFDAENKEWKLAASGGGGGGGGSATLIEKSITANGTYNASSDSADGYSKVTVDVDSSFNTIESIIINNNDTDEKVAIRRSSNGIYNISHCKSIEILLDPVVKINFEDEGLYPSISFTPAENFDGIYKFGNKLIPSGDTITSGDGKLYRYYLNSWASWTYGTITKHDTNFIHIIS